METVKLPAGKTAPRDADCICIEKRPDGGYDLNAAILTETESVAIVGGDPYETQDAAEAAGMAWADEQGVDTLYIETDRA